MGYCPFEASRYPRVFRLVPCCWRAGSARFQGACVRSGRELLRRALRPGVAHNAWCARRTGHRYRPCLPLSCWSQGALQRRSTQPENCSWCLSACQLATVCDARPPVQSAPDHWLLAVLLLLCDRLALPSGQTPMPGACRQDGASQAQAAALRLAAVRNTQLAGNTVERLTGGSVADGWHRPFVDEVLTCWQWPPCT